MNTESKAVPIIYTIGHSTHPLDDLITVLGSFRIKKLIDVRTIPKSRFNPQFNKENLAHHLPLHGMDYQHMAGLGGLRPPQKDSVNMGWRNSSFRGYADYMQGDEFEKSLAVLMEEGKKAPVAIMCAEALPWRCHRSLIADALISRGFEIIDIMGLNKGTFHVLNPMAKAVGSKIHYPKVKS